MSYLRFERIGQVQLFSNAGQRLGSWSAHNDAASKSKGAWPTGRYTWSHFNPHPEMGYAPACIATAYGCEGIHVFDVSAHGRSGMGIHAGRVRNPDAFGLSIGGRTLGCVRTSEAAMTKINQTHNRDPLTHIEICAGWFGFDETAQA